MSSAAEGVARTAEWLSLAGSESEGPVDRLADLDAALKSEGRALVPAAFHRALSFCLPEAPLRPEAFEHPDRLPLTLAAAHVREFAAAPLEEFLKHVFECWIFGQHTYWAVGRGLADARSNGRQLLRLRVVIDDGGWCLTRGATAPNPIATADRLATILSLSGEANILGLKAG